MIVCLGKFDALHRGHRALVGAAARLGEPALLGFTGMAEALGWPPRPPLVAAGDRPRILAGWAAGLAVPAVGWRELPFAQVRTLDAGAFLDLLHAGMPARGVVMGADFRGGTGRATDAAGFAALARARGLQAAVVDPVADAGGAISSSRVRAALAAGDCAAATGLLGRPYRLLGTVVRGDGRGRSIGIPTANLGEPANLVPGSGVYACWAHLAGASAPVPAALNIGTVPTAGSGRPLTVEAHLVGWTGDCYGRGLALDLVARIRTERRFPSFPELVARIRADIDETRRLLSRTQPLPA